MLRVRQFAAALVAIAFALQATPALAQENPLDIAIQSTEGQRSQLVEIDGQEISLAQQRLSYFAAQVRLAKKSCENPEYRMRKTAFKVAVAAGVLTGLGILAATKIKFAEIGARTINLSLAITSMIGVGAATTGTAVVLTMTTCHEAEVWMEKIEEGQRHLSILESELKLIK